MGSVPQRVAECNRLSASTWWVDVIAFVLIAFLEVC